MPGASALMARTLPCYVISSALPASLSDGLAASVDPVHPVADRVLPARFWIAVRAPILSYAPLVPRPPMLPSVPGARRSRPRIAAVGRHSRLDPSGFHTV